MELYEQSWQGKTEPSDKSGTAKFLINNEEFEFNFQSFSEFVQINDLLSAVANRAAFVAIKDVRQATIRLFNEAEDRIGC